MTLSLHRDIHISSKRSRMQIKWSSSSSMLTGWPWQGFGLRDAWPCLWVGWQQGVLCRWHEPCKHFDPLPPRAPSFAWCKRGLGHIGSSSECWQGVPSCQGCWQHPRGQHIGSNLPRGSGRSRRGGGRLVCQWCSLEKHITQWFVPPPCPLLLSGALWPFHHWAAWWNRWIALFHCWEGWWSWGGVPCSLCTLVGILQGHHCLHPSSVVVLPAQLWVLWPSPDGHHLWFWWC